MTSRRGWLALVLLWPHVTAAAVTEVHYVMGTYFRITIDRTPEAGSRAAMRRCFTMARQLEALFSRFDPASELSRINATASDGRTVPVGAEMAALLQRAVALQDATDGAFDAGIGALTELWRGASEWPSSAQIDAARQTLGRGALTVAGHTLIRRAGTRIDLDGIGKGWAVDRCVAQLRTAGVRRALLSLGESSIYALGAPPGRRGWEVTLRGLDTDSALGTLTLRDAALSVSAVFGHAQQVAGTRVGHIADPRTGRPLIAAAMAAVVAASATDAEAFSKALLIWNAEGRPLRPHALISGALLVRADGVQRAGRIAFTAFPVARRVAVTAEPLR